MAQRVLHTIIMLASVGLAVLSIVSVIAFWFSLCYKSADKPPNLDDACFKRFNFIPGDDWDKVDPSGLLETGGSAAFAIITIVLALCTSVVSFLALTKNTPGYVLLTNMGLLLTTIASGAAMGIFAHTFNNYNDLIASSQYELDYSGGFVAEVFTFIIAALSWGLSLFVYMKGRSNPPPEELQDGIAQHVLRCWFLLNFLGPMSQCDSPAGGSAL